MLLSIDKPRFLLVGIVIALCAVVLGCSDGVTGPSHPSETALKKLEGPLAKDWDCWHVWYSDGSESWGCAYTQTESQSVGYWEPPPSFGSSLVTTEYTYCAENPAACGGGSGSGSTNPYQPCEGFFDDSGWVEDGVWLNPQDAANNAKFDCRFVKCPPPSVYLNSLNVSKAAAALIQLTKQTGKEWGAWLYLNPDGTIRVSLFIEGTATSIPSMGMAPDLYAIGSIHSHPPGAEWQQAPSNQDKVHALMNNFYAVVASAAGKLYITPEGPQEGWMTSSPNPPDPPASCF